MVLQRCLWHDSGPGARKPTGEGAMFPLTDEYWAPNKLTKSGLMTSMCRACKARRLKWTRHKDIRDAKQVAEPVIIERVASIVPRFKPTVGNVISIFRAV